MAYEVLSTRTLVHRDPLSYNVHEIRLPDGTIIEKDVIGHPGAVAIMPVKDDGKIVMVRQYRLAADAELLEVPAGTLERGEAPAACAERELQEEAGYFPGRLEALDGFWVAPGVSQEFIYLFIARDLRPSRLVHDMDEQIEVVEVTLEDALERINRGEIRDAKSIIGLLRLARL